MLVYAYIHPELNILCVSLDQNSVPLNVKYEVFDVQSVDDLMLDNGVIRLKTDEDRKKELLPQAQTLLNSAYFTFINNLLRKHGYNGIGDLIYYANTKNEAEAKDLLDFYDKFDAIFWNYYANLNNLSLQEIKNVIINPNYIIEELRKNV
jgi:hypothetical protein